MNVYDIASYFSYRGLPFPLRPQPTVVAEVTGYNSTTVAQKQNYGRNDFLGRPVFQPLTIGGLYLPNSIITISVKKNIVTTSVTGRAGTIKELVSSEDYNINIKGAFVNNDGSFPAYEMEQINQYFQAKENYDIDNELCSLLGIEKVVFTSLDFPTSGKTNVLLYNISCLSDYDYTLEIES